LIPLDSWISLITSPTYYPNTLSQGILATSQIVILTGLSLRWALIEEALSSPIKEAPTTTTFSALSA